MPSKLVKVKEGHPFQYIARAEGSAADDFNWESVLTQFLRGSALSCLD